MQVPRSHLTFIGDTVIVYYSMVLSESRVKTLLFSHARQLLRRDPLGTTVNHAYNASTYIKGAQAFSSDQVLEIIHSSLLTLFQEFSSSTTLSLWQIQLYFILQKNQEGTKKKSWNRPEFLPTCSSSSVPWQLPGQPLYHSAELQSSG